MRSVHTHAEQPPQDIRSSLGPWGGGRGLTDKRLSVRKALASQGVYRLEQLRNLTPSDQERLKADIEFFEKHPEIPLEEVESHFRNTGSAYTTVADLIGKKGREALQEIRDKLPSAKVQ